MRFRLPGEVPNVLVGRGIEAALDDVSAVGEIGVQRSDETRRDDRFWSRRSLT